MKITTLEWTLVVVLVGMLLGGVALVSSFDEAKPEEAQNAERRKNPRRKERTLASEPRAQGETWRLVSREEAERVEPLSASAPSTHASVMPLTADPAPTSNASAVQRVTVVPPSPERTPAPAKREVVTRVLWKKRGLCADESGERERWAAFQQVEASWNRGLFVHPEVSAETIEVVRQVVPGLPRRVRNFLGLSSEPPRVFIYKDQEALRAHSCVNGLAVAYYDGSIHLSAVTGRSVGDGGGARELIKSLEHEYVHHVLLTNAIGLPVWFQEGAAMVFAKESWDGYRFQAEPIPLATMVQAFAHTSEPDAAQAFYLQAYGMTRLLRSLWRGPARGSEQELIDRLLTGRSSVDSLFEDALRERLPRLGLSPPEFLATYIRSGFRCDLCRDPPAQSY